MNCLYKYKAEQVVFALKVFVQTLTSIFVYSRGSQMHSCICWLCVRSRTSCGKIIKIKTSAFNVDFQTLKLRIHQQCKLYNVCEERWQKWILYYPNSRVWLCLIKGNGGRTGPERGDNTHQSWQILSQLHSNVLKNYIKSSQPIFNSEAYFPLNCL